MGIDWRPIHAAVYSESQKLLELLVENGADINVKNKEVANFTPLHIAISIEEPPLQLVNYLLKRGANLNIPDENGEVNYHQGLRSMVLLYPTQCVGYRRNIDLIQSLYHPNIYLLDAIASSSFLGSSQSCQAFCRKRMRVVATQ
jgi:hypothetical protein